MLFRRKGLVALFFGVWIAAVVAGFGAMARYASRPGASYPAEAGAAAQLYSQYGKPHRPLLVMVVHPRCPCTSASSDELADLVAKAHGRCDVLLLSYLAPGWAVPSPTERVANVEARVVPDPEGRLGARLGAATSGHVLLIDPEGRVRFYGGLTVIRGHRGQSPAQEAILRVIAGGSGDVHAMPVYGCSLQDHCEREGGT